MIILDKNTNDKDPESDAEILEAMKKVTFHEVYIWSYVRSIDKITKETLLLDAVRMYLERKK